MLLLSYSVTATKYGAQGTDPLKQGCDPVPLMAIEVSCKLLRVFDGPLQWRMSDIGVLGHNEPAEQGTCWPLANAEYL